MQGEVDENSGETINLESDLSRHNHPPPSPPFPGQCNRLLKCHQYYVMCMCEFLTTSDTIWSRSQGTGVQIYANLLQGSGIIYY